MGSHMCSSPTITRLRVSLIIGVLFLIAFLTYLQPHPYSPAWLVSKPIAPINDHHKLPSTESPLVTESQSCTGASRHPKTTILPPWDSSYALKGPPTDRAFDNLREDKAYVTAWTTDGFTNQFMGYMNLIYLGVLSNRIPIIPPFTPNFHLADGARLLPFSEVFNISSLRDAIRYPVIEWSDVKRRPTLDISTEPTPLEREQIGCWSTRRPRVKHPMNPVTILNHLRLDPSYTRFPSAVRFNQTDPEDYFVVLNEIVPFIYPGRPQHHNEGIMSPTSGGVEIPPNAHLTCIDHLYYASTTHAMFEWEREWSPLWRNIGRHAHFTDKLINLARQYVANTFSADVSHLPPYVAVHMRRTDFSNTCSKRPNCLIPLSVFEKKVAEVKEKAEAKFGYPIEKVLVFSDDETPEFWDQVEDLGWSSFDHAGLGTGEKYGQWYPTLIDVVAQSMAHAFVGTGQSTFSLLALRRVTNWQDGPAVMIWN